MVAVGFCSYWGLAVAAAAGSTAAAVAVSGYFYTTLGFSSLHCHGGVLGFCKLSLFRYQWSKEGQVCGLRAKVHVCRCGAFSVPRLDLVLDLVFFLYQNPSCSIQTRKRACFAFLFVGVNSAHEKRPVGNRRSDGIRSKTNRTMIIWSRLVQASVSNGQRGFARSVPGRVVASVLIGNSCQTQTLQGLWRMGVVYTIMNIFRELSGFRLNAHMWIPKI